MSTEVEKLEKIETELNDQGTTSDSIETELSDQGTTLDDIKVELIDQGTVLDTISNNQTDGTQKVEIVDDSGDIVTIDDHTRAFVNVEYEEHEINEGNHFFVANFETVDDDDSIDFVVEAPDSDTALHMIFEVEGTSQTEFRIYENATVAADGSVTAAINNNRNSNNSSVATVRKDPTISNVGTLIFSQSKGLAGTPASKADSEGLVKRGREIVLKRNSKTLFRITSKDDGNIISYVGEWYENGV